jgi:hypothetical protein
VPPRSKPSAAAGADLEGLVEKMLVKLPETLRVAQENGAQGARATIESCNNVIRGLEAALKAKDERIQYYEGLVKAQFADWANVLKKNAEQAQIGSDERIKIAEVQASADFRKTLVKELAPAAPPAVMALLKKLGVLEDDGLLLNASGDEIELDRAAYWEMINMIAIQPPLQAALSDAIGKDKWARVMTHLQREYMAAQAKAVAEQAKTNGVSN